MRVALSSAASLNYWSSLRQTAVAQRSAGAEERGERGARTEAPPRRPVPFPHQPQPEPEPSAGSPKTEKEGRKDGGELGTCSEERAQTLRSAPPGAKTQVGSKPRPCVFFILGGRAGGGGHCAFSPRRNRFGILWKTKHAERRSLQQRGARRLQIKSQ